jgi:hypothetical protein
MTSQQHTDQPQTTNHRTRSRTRLPGRRDAQHNPAAQAHPQPPTRPRPTNTISDLHAEPRIVHGDRSIKYRWPIRTVTHDYHGEGVLYAELSIGHSTHSKEFSASLAPTTAYATGWGTTSYRLTRPYWHRRQRVDRYTAKRLQEFAVAALAQFRADADARHPAILDVFEVDQ